MMSQRRQGKRFLKKNPENTPVGKSTNVAGN